MLVATVIAISLANSLAISVMILFVVFMVMTMLLDPLYTEARDIAEKDFRGKPLPLESLEFGEVYEVISNYRYNDNSGNHLILRQGPTVILCSTEKDDGAENIKPGQKITRTSEEGFRARISIIP